MIPEVLGGISLLVWAYLLLGRGQFWRVSEQLLAPLPLSSKAPRVAVVIPARDEAHVIARSVTSVLLQDYPGDVHIYVVDDHSSDATAAMARSAAAALRKTDRLSVISSAALPAGWTGKLWAVSQGIYRAAEFRPEWLWLTDADILHGRGTLRNLVSKATNHNLDMVSLLVKLRCQSWAERALIPAFVFFFFMLYPPRWVAEVRRRTAAAAGGCILVRRRTLTQVGGIDTINDQVIDDCALARLIKQVGRIWLGLTNESHSIRRYGWADVERMISRSAFAQLNHSCLLAAATLAGMAVTYLVPPILVFFGGWTAAIGAAGWLLMAVAFLPMLRFYGLSPLWSPALPAIAVFYGFATVHSAIQYWMGRGGQWKGRAQDRAA